MNIDLLNGSHFAFLFVATMITAVIFLSKFRFKCLRILWKSALISYITFLIFTVFMGLGSYNLNNMIPSMGFVLIGFSFLLLTPGLLIYGLIPGVIKPCPSDTDVFGWFICSFIFYMFVIWGIMTVIKKSKENKLSDIKQKDSLEKQPPPGADSKGI